jgi:hypothetical protein
LFLYKQVIVSAPILYQLFLSLKKRNAHLLDFAASLKLKGLHFGLEDPIPTRIYQDLVALKKSQDQQITSFTLPLVPQMFVPLILANHGSITGTYLIHAVGSSGIGFWKQKRGITFNFD